MIGGRWRAGARTEPPQFRPVRRVGPAATARRWGSCDSGAATRVGAKGSGDVNSATQRCGPSAMVGASWRGAMREVASAAASKQPSAGTPMVPAEVLEGPVARTTDA